MPVDAITGAQTRPNVEVQTEVDALTSKMEKQARKSYWRKWRQQKAEARRKRREVKETANEKSEEPGSVLADKVFEPLKALLDAYEASRLKPNQTLEERYRAYPDPPLEQK